MCVFRDGGDAGMTLPSLLHTANRTGFGHTPENKTRTPRIASHLLIHPLAYSRTPRF